MITVTSRRRWIEDRETAADVSQQKEITELRTVKAVTISLLSLYFTLLHDGNHLNVETE
jgi:hypothetical protein